MSVQTAAVSSGALRRWRRFTPAERITRSCFYLVTLIAVVWSLQTIDVIPEFLYDAPQQTADLFTRMWPIDWAWYPKVVHPALIETLHTATLGTLLAVALASLVALLVARNITRSCSTPSGGSSWSRHAQCTRWYGRCSSWLFSARAR
jgi:ABC-type phosphate/phosphonate transport system permease subunit